MFKIVFKHFIYDFCIDMLFNRIISNFKSTRSTKFPKVGEFYSRISHVDNNEHYFNCIIKNIERRINKNKEPYHLVYIRYEYCNGDIFEDDDWAEEELENYFYNIDDEEIEEFEEELREAGKSYKEWYDNDAIESIEVDNDEICFNSNYYVFYK